MPPSLTSSSGVCVRQISCAFQQRVWKRHALGGFVGDGTSPDEQLALLGRRQPRVGTGTADISAPVYGIRGCA